MLGQSRCARIVFRPIAAKQRHRGRLLWTLKHSGRAAPGKRFEHARLIAWWCNCIWTFLKPKNSLSWRLGMHMSRPWDRNFLVHYRQGLARLPEAGTIRCRRLANQVATAMTCIYRPTAAAWSRHVACGAFSPIFTGVTSWQARTFVFTGFTDVMTR